MRKTRLFLVALMIATTVSFVGCDKQAAQHAAAQRNLDDALAILAIAQQGYAPLTDQGQTQDMQTFRQTQLVSAQVHLREVVAHGSADQQVMAKRLLASTQLSAARYAARHAMGEFAALSARAPVLVGMLQATERAAAQASRADVDYDDALAQIATDTKASESRRAKLQARADTLGKERDDWQAKLDAEAAKTATAIGEARTAMDKTFVAEADDRMAHQDQADAAQRRAAVASAEAEKYQIQIDLINNRLTIITTQRETLDSQIKDLQQQAQQTRELQITTTQAIAQARHDQDIAAGELKTEFDLLAAVYQQSVRQPLGDAADLAGKAGDQLLSGVGGPDQLSGYVDQTYINTQRAIATAGWANLVSMILEVADTASLSEAGTYRAQQQEAQADHDAATQAAQTAIASGRESAESLSTAHTALADQQAQRLGDFERQLAQNMIK